MERKEVRSKEKAEPSHGGEENKKLGRSPGLGKLVRLTKNTFKTKTNMKWQANDGS